MSPTKSLYDKTDGIIWMRDMGNEPGDEGNIKTMEKDAISKTVNGCIRRTNEEIYEYYQKPQLDSIIKARRLQWLGHMERVTEERTVRRIAWKTPGCKKKRGRPRKDGERLCWRT